VPLLPAGGVVVPLPADEVVVVFELGTRLTDGAAGPAGVGVVPLLPAGGVVVPLLPAAGVVVPLLPACEIVELDGRLLEFGVVPLLPSGGVVVPLLPAGGVVVPLFPAGGVMIVFKLDGG
jgi:hypothetical protein